MFYIADINPRVICQLLYKIYSTLFIEETVSESLTSSTSVGIIKFKIIATLISPIILVNGRWSWINRGKKLTKP